MVNIQDMVLNIDDETKKLVGLDKQLEKLKSHGLGGHTGAQSYPNCGDDWYWEDYPCSTNLRGY